MVDTFIVGDFPGCLEAADVLESACGPSKLAALYRRLARTCQANRPADFHGLIVLETK